MARSLVALAAAAVLTIGCSGEAPGADTAKAPRAASAPAQRSGPALWVVKAMMRICPPHMGHSSGNAS